MHECFMQQECFCNVKHDFFRVIYIEYYIYLHIFSMEHEIQEIAQSISCVGWNEAAPPFHAIGPQYDVPKFPIEKIEMEKRLQARNRTRQAYTNFIICEAVFGSLFFFVSHISIKQSIK